MHKEGLQFTCKSLTSGTISIMCQFIFPRKVRTMFHTTLPDNTCFSVMCKAYTVKGGTKYSRTSMAPTPLEQCSRQGEFELMSVDLSARSGGIIGINFRFSLT